MYTTVFRECELFMERPSRDSYSATNLLEWREADSLIISPKFQRRSVWRLPQRSYLIDTLLRQMPVPPIYLRNNYDLGKSKVIREVIDGQQRLRAVLEFIDGKYALSKSLNSPHKGKKFSALPDSNQTDILKYRFNCETFDDISDREVLEVFSRLNMYSIPLNDQELRNGRYFGQFKQARYSLAHNHLELWRQWGMFTEIKIARMAEVQLTSAMLIAQLEGLQDKNKSISDFYAEYDEEFSQRTTHEKRFNATMDEIAESLNDMLRENQFSNPAFFYTLFCSIYHRMFGLPKIKLSTPKKRLSLSDRDGLKSAVDKLSDIISAAREEQKIARSQEAEDSEPSGYSAIPLKYRGFATACLSQTDNVAPREKRLQTLYRESFN